MSSERVDPDFQAVGFKEEHRNEPPAVVVVTVDIIGQLGISEKWKKKIQFTAVLHEK